jgi:hypothetical protein
MSNFSTYNVSLPEQYLPQTSALVSSTVKNIQTQGPSWFRGQINKSAAFGQQLWGNLSRTGAGRVVQRGIAMDFGFEQPGNKGPFKFMGGAFEGARQGGWSQIAKNVGGSNLAVAGKLALRGLPMLFAGANILHGFRQNGLTGAGSAVIENAMWGVGFEAAKTLLWNPIGIGLAGVAVGAFAYKKFHDNAIKYGRGLRRVEMGSGLGVDDPFGSVATLRQRSLMALQNTHLNGRMALGNEAAMLHM